MTVREVCKAVGLKDKFSNHSLRATCASHMYKNDIPEQVIKEVMGHKSDCVRVYKRTSDKMRQNASHTLSKADVECKKIKLSDDVESDESCQDEVKDEKVEEGPLSMKQIIENVNKTKIELRRKKFQIARSRLSLKRRKRQNQVTIDVNLNIKKK